jgi:hypothetical protein
MSRRGQSRQRGEREVGRRPRGRRSPRRTARPRRRTPGPTRAGRAGLTTATATGAATSATATATARILRRVLRVPGRRRIVDGELARRLDGGLRVGLVIAGCGPAPADPVPIAAHNASWCARAPSCRAGATLAVRPVPLRGRPIPPAFPLRRRPLVPGSGDAHCPSLIIERPTQAGPSTPDTVTTASQPAQKRRTQPTH